MINYVIFATNKEFFKTYFRTHSKYKESYFYFYSSTLSSRSMYTCLFLIRGNVKQFKCSAYKLQRFVTLLICKNSSVYRYI